MSARISHADAQVWAAFLAGAGKHWDKVKLPPRAVVRGGVIELDGWRLVRKADQTWVVREKGGR